MRFPQYSQKTIDALLSCEYINCLPSGGGIVPAFGAELLGELPAQIISAHCAKGTGLIYLFTEGGLYITYDNATFVRINGRRYTGAFMTEYADGGDIVAMACADTVMYLHGKSSYTMRVLAQKLCCGIYRRGRLFGACADSPQRILWSRTDELNEFDGGVDGGGYLDLSPARGNVLDMRELDGKLVAVREYGLSVLDMFGSPENFAEKITDTDCEKIYKNTAAVAGGKLVFCTAAGVRAFDGSRITQINSPEFENPVCAAAYGSGYYIACDCKFTGGRAVLYLNAESGECCFIDVPADSLCAGDGVYAYFESSIYKITAGGKYRCVAKLDFGTGKNKTLSKINIGGVADLKISNGRLSRTFKDASGEVCPRMRGKYFTLEICGNEKIEYVEACAEVSVGI